MVAVSELAGGPAGAPGCADSVTVSTEASRQQLRSQHVAWRQHSNIYTVPGGYEAECQRVCELQPPPCSKVQVGNGSCTHSLAHYQNWYEAGNLRWGLGRVHSRRYGLAGATRHGPQGHIVTPRCTTGSLPGNGPRQNCRTQWPKPHSAQGTLDAPSPIHSESSEPPSSNCLLPPGLAAGARFHPLLPPCRCLTRRCSLGGPPPRQRSTTARSVVLCSSSWSIRSALQPVTAGQSAGSPTHTHSSAGPSSRTIDHRTGPTGPPSDQQQVSRQDWAARLLFSPRRAPPW